MSKTEKGHRNDRLRHIKQSILMDCPKLCQTNVNNSLNVVEYGRLRGSVAIVTNDPLYWCLQGYYEGGHNWCVDMSTSNSLPVCENIVDSLVSIEHILTKHASGSFNYITVIYPLTSVRSNRQYIHSIHALQPTCTALSRTQAMLQGTI